MKSLLNELEASVGKTAYQTYTLQHGIEKLTLLIPLKNVSVFEADFAACTDKSKKALVEVVTRHHGKVKA